MARRRLSAATRNSGAARLFRWLMLALAGTIGGVMLADLAIGNRTNGLRDEASSFSRLSANPGALVPQGEAALACTDCADSYGAAMQRRAYRDARMSEEFRQLGTVEVDPPRVPDPVDDYRYGGRFPDPGPDDARSGTPIEDTASPAPAGDIPPAEEMPLPSAEY